MRDLRGGAAIRAGRRQSWTTLEKLSQTHMNSLPNTSRACSASAPVCHRPARAAGQTPGGNVLWVCDNFSSVVQLWPPAARIAAPPRRSRMRGRLFTLRKIAFPQAVQMKDGMAFPRLVSWPAYLLR